VFAHFGFDLERASRALGLAARPHEPLNTAPSWVDVDMWPATDALLRTVFCPFNEALARELDELGGQDHAAAAEIVRARWNQLAKARPRRAEADGDAAGTGAAAEGEAANATTDASEEQFAESLFGAAGRALLWRPDSAWPVAAWRSRAANVTCA
jgi:hypothetical protein